MNMNNGLFSHSPGKLIRNYSDFLIKDLNIGICYIDDCVPVNGTVCSILKRPYLLLQGKFGFKKVN